MYFNSLLYYLYICVVIVFYYFFNYYYYYLFNLGRRIDALIRLMIKNPQKPTCQQVSGRTGIFFNKQGQKRRHSQYRSVDKPPKQVWVEKTFQMEE